MNDIVLQSIGSLLHLVKQSINTAKSNSPFPCPLFPVVVVKSRFRYNLLLNVHSEVVPECKVEAALSTFSTSDGSNEAQPNYPSLCVPRSVQSFSPRKLSYRSLNATPSMPKITTSPSDSSSRSTSLLSCRRCT